MRILVLGDRILDHYSFCKATRLCPEAPAPVLIAEKTKVSNGGASLVVDQLEALAGGDSVSRLYGSLSEKHRIFADRQMVCRIDKDSQQVQDAGEYEKSISAFISEGLGADGTDAVVVSDYGKGAMTPVTGRWITGLCIRMEIPLFVDAKHNLQPYEGCYAIFPNELEHDGISPASYTHIIRKLGPRGCSVDGYIIPTEEQQVYDVTGAGDIFLAAFVYKWLSGSQYPEPRRCYHAAEFANKVAGISVRHLGTYVVSRDEIR